MALIDKDRGEPAAYGTGTLAPSITHGSFNLMIDQLKIAGYRKPPQIKWPRGGYSRGEARHLLQTGEPSTTPGTFEWSRLYGKEDKWASCRNTVRRPQSASTPGTTLRILSDVVAPNRSAAAQCEPLVTTVGAAFAGEAAEVSSAQPSPSGSCGLRRRRPQSAPVARKATDADGILRRPVYAEKKASDLWPTDVSERQRRSPQRPATAGASRAVMAAFAHRDGPKVANYERPTPVDFGRRSGKVPPVGHVPNFGDGQRGARRRRPRSAVARLRRVAVAT